MIDEKINELEQQDGTRRIIELLRKERDTHEATIKIPPFGKRPTGKKRMGLISPYWLIAASTIGFVAGFFTPKQPSSSGNEGNFAHVDTVSMSSGCSIAQMDVNTALLITL